MASDLSALEALSQMPVETLKGALRSRSATPATSVEPLGKQLQLAGTYIPPRSMRGIRKITLKHRRMVALHIQGKTNAEIARILGCAPGTVSVVLSNPTIRDVMRRIGDVYDDYIADLKPLVYEVLRETLTSGTRSEKMKAIDRWGALTGEFKEPDRKDDSAEDVIQRALKIRHQGADGSITEISYGEQSNA